MVSVWCVAALLLTFTASNVDAEVCSTTAGDTCPSIEAVSQEKRTIQTTEISILEQSTASQFADENETSNDEEDQQAVDISHATQFIPRPASLSKQLHVITDLIDHNLADNSHTFRPSVNDGRWTTPLQTDMSGEEILMQYGLQPVHTPATGNCQYYAVAMSLLDLRFDTPQHVEALEQVTQRLKEGIAEAIPHGYDVEFPHDIRQTILVSTQLDVNDQELTIPESEEESDLLFQEFFYAIAESPSKISAYLPMELWGTEVTLRMMAKLLQQSIFVVTAPYGLQTAVDYLVYKPERVTRGGYELDSAEQLFIARSNSEQWFDQLQQACSDSSSMTNPPIVLLFSNFHYNRLQFVELPVPIVGGDRSEL